jgi:hypothetical protein
VGVLYNYMNLRFRMHRERETSISEWYQKRMDGQGERKKPPGLQSSNIAGLW